MAETNNNQEKDDLESFAKEMGFSDYHNIFEEFPYFEAIEEIKKGEISYGMLKDVAMLAYFSEQYFLRLFPLLNEEDYCMVTDGNIDHRNYKLAHIVSMATTAYTGIWECCKKEITLGDVHKEPNPKLRGLSAILMIFLLEVTQFYEAWSSIEQFKHVFEDTVEDFNIGFRYQQEMFPDIRDTRGKSE